MRWLSAILLMLIVAVSSPHARTPTFEQASIAALDQALQPGDVPAPSFELRRPAFSGELRSSPRREPATCERLRALFSRVPQGARTVVFRTRPRRHVPRMGSGDPDLT